MLFHSTVYRYRLIKEAELQWYIMSMLVYKSRWPLKWCFVSNSSPAPLVSSMNTNSFRTRAIRTEGCLGCIRPLLTMTLCTNLKPGAGYQPGLQLADEPVGPFKSSPEISIGCCAVFLTGSVRPLRDHPAATTLYPWTDVNNESGVCVFAFLYCGLSVIDMD